MSHPDHVGVALSISMAGYVLGGSSYFQALLFFSAWAGLIYYCCHEIYECYMFRRLSTDMADIQAHYLDNLDNCLWVAAAEVNGQPKLVGMVAVTGKQEERSGEERVDDWNGGVIGGIDLEDGDECLGELVYMSVDFAFRRKGLGLQLMQKALDFCKERDYKKLVVDTSSAQTAANSMYERLGFVETTSHRNTHANRFISRLARIVVVRIEKVL